ncbi:MAG: hypothetical protein WD067_10090 [Gaiellaceae bacterium]
MGGRLRNGVVRVAQRLDHLPDVQARPCQRRSAPAGPVPEADQPMLVAARPLVGGRSVRYRRGMRPTPDAPKMGQRGWLPDEDAIRRAEFGSTTPGQRVAEAIAISRTATKIAAAGKRRRAR